ncbi:MAG: cell division protein FtsA [Pseudomonadota bacterium]
MSKKKALRTAAGANVFAAVDIGAAKTLCLIAARSASGDLEIIGVGQQGASLSETRKSYARTVEITVRGAVEAAERMAGVRIQEAVLLAPGRRLVSRRVGVDLDLAGGAATMEDTETCLDRGAATARREGETTVHALPVRFCVDGEEVGEDPSGVIGGVLSAEMLGVSLRSTSAENYRALLEKCDLRLTRFIARPYAAGEAVLIEDEKDLGALLIDIGARSTDFALYRNGAMVACGGVAAGGEHVTRDIAQVFSCSIADAERIKALHGSAFAGAGDDHRLIDARILGEDGDINRISRAELSSVIAARLEEIYALVATAMRRSSVRDADAMRRAVLTGGGSLLAGALEMSERAFGVRTRLGRPGALVGSPDAATAPQCAACVGALMIAARADGDRALRTGCGALSTDAALRGRAGVVVELTRWLKRNF